MRPGFSVHKVLLFDTLLVFVLLQVLAHLHMFWVGLEVGVGRCCCLIRLLQLQRDTDREGKDVIVSGGILRGLHSSVFEDVTQYWY